MKLRLQELVVLALVDEDRPAPRTGADEGGGVVRGPGRPIVSEVAAERLLAPRALRRGADRSEGGHRPVPVRVLEGDGQRPVAAHRVPEHSGRVVHDRKSRRDQGAELSRDPGIHPIVRGPGRLRRVQVEAGAGSEVPVVVLPRDGCAPGARVGHHQREPEAARVDLGARLDGRGLLRAGQPGQEPEHGHRSVPRGRWQVDREPHRRAGFARIVSIEALHAAVAALFRECLHRLRTAPRCELTPRRASGRTRC